MSEEMDTVFQKQNLRKTTIDSTVRISPEIYYASQAKEKREIIANFVSRNNLEMVVYHKNGKKLLLLNPKNTDVLDQSKVDTYIKLQIAAEKKGIITNCFKVANKACLSGKAVGRICAYKGTSDFVGWGSHCINFDELSDETVIAFDLTTSANIDHDGGNLSVLAIRSSTLESLLKQVGELYGGEWQVIQTD